MRSHNHNIIGLLLICLCFVFSCSQKKDRKVSRGFYYWKTNVHPSDFEKSVMDSLNAKYLYTRFFDVVLSANGQNAQPSAMANFAQPLPNQKIIPVIYITREALKAMNAQNLDFYARNIVALIKKKADSIHLQPEEIQIDCDWTRRSKNIYFALLTSIRRQPYLKNKTLSCTIRMHQIKYSKATGIPPVDRGILMVYNMDDLTNFYVKNSIITLKTTKKYLDNLPAYPLPLDIALPIYSWSLLFRHKSLLGILREVKITDLKNKALFKKKNNNRYLVIKDTLYKGYNLKKNDIIRYENSSYNTVRCVAAYISDKLEEDTLTILLYYCDNKNFKIFSPDEMEKIFNDFD